MKNFLARLLNGRHASEHVLATTPNAAADVADTPTRFAIARRRTRATAVMSIIFGVLAVITWSAASAAITMAWHSELGGGFPWGLIVLMAPFVGGLGMATGVVFSLVLMMFQRRKVSLTSLTTVVASVCAGVVVFVLGELFFGAPSSSTAERMQAGVGSALVGAVFGSVIASIARRRRAANTEHAPQF